VLDYSAAGVRASVEESLARLGLDRVDILYVHDPELSGIPGATESALEALAELRDEGIVAAAVFNSGLDHGVDLPAAALQYPLRDPRVISVVAGCLLPVKEAPR
jgi:aryl-alcohol dehydrogenase-like predicted oxidoreductase